MTARLYQFVRVAYPPRIYLPLTLLWGAGLTGLLIAVSAPGHAGPWDGGTAITVATLCIDMLLVRALDDIRDLDYDRVHAPGRPLPSGMVKVGDLVALVATGTAALLLLNIGRGAALAVLAAQLGYAIVLVTVNTRLHWLVSENRFLELAINIPVQILLSAYVYVAYLHDGHQRPGAAGLLATAAVILALIHVEFARKTTRAPARTQRTYIHHIGIGGTVGAALGTAVLAVALAAAALHPWAASSAAHAWGWLAVAPIALPAAAGWNFWRRRLPQWPVLGAISFPMLACAIFLAISLASRGVPH
jgi:hypothetical protein